LAAGSLIQLHGAHRILEDPMAQGNTLDKLLDKAYEGKDFKELADAPVSALAGVSDADAEALKKAFGIKTIGDLAGHKAIVAAQAIAALAKLG
jgi:hypothetical protein